jgi:hypothetical protein
MVAVIKGMVILLFVLLLCNCNERYDNNDSANRNKNILSLDNKVLESEDEIQEVIENYNQKMILLFQVEGNFTGTGNREILAFYQSKSTLVIEGTVTHSIRIAFCFVCDSTGKQIINTYELTGYKTMDFDSLMNIDDAPIEVLGREIFWLERRFGFIGDFNKNGKEELYFYQASGIGFYPFFLEFTGMEFIKILEPKKNFVLFEIFSIDSANKIISFIGKGGTEEYFSYIWNNIEQKYVLQEQ